MNKMKRMIMVLFGVLYCWEGAQAQLTPDKHPAESTETTQVLEQLSADHIENERLELKVYDHVKHIEEKVMQHVERMNEQFVDVAHKIQDKIEATLTATVQQLRDLEKKVDEAVTHKKKKQQPEDDQKNIKKMTKKDLPVVNRTIKEEVAAQMDILRGTIKEKEKKQKRKKAFEQLLNQLEVDDD